MRSALLALPLLAISTPAFATAAVRPGAHGVKFASVLADAGPVAKLICLALVVAALTAIVLAIVNGVTRNPRPRGARFVAGLRMGGILAGLAGAAFLTMNNFVGLVYSGGIPPFIVLAPGLAEIFLLVTAGLIASTTAVFIHPHMSFKAE